MRIRRGPSPVVVRGWKAWKKRMNFKYWGIFWSVGPKGEMEMNLTVLNISAKMITGMMRRSALLFCRWDFSWKNYIYYGFMCVNILTDTMSKFYECNAYHIQVVSKNSGISKFITCCVISLVLLSYKDNHSCFHKIKFSLVILSIIVTWAPSDARDINITFYTIRADIISLVFSQRLVNIESWSTHTHILVPLYL